MDATVNTARPFDPRIHELLARDPAHAFVWCDELTQASYHAAIDQLSQWTRCPAVEIALMVLALAERAPQGTVERHVGYYLIDDGRSHLEEKLGCSVPFASRLSRTLRHRARQIYFAGVLCCSLFCMTALAAVVNARSALLQVAWLIL